MVAGLVVGMVAGLVMGVVGFFMFAVTAVRVGPSIARVLAVGLAEVIHRRRSAPTH